MDINSIEEPALVEALQSLVVNENHDNSIAGITNENDDDHGVGVSSISTDSPNLSSTNTNSNSSNTTATLNPIYIPTASGNDTWELTWPIWHMLPVQERKDIAKQNGFKSIGEFEESVILSRTLNEDTKNLNIENNSGNQFIPPPPYSSEQMYEMENRPQNYGLPILAERSDVIREEVKNNSNNDDNGDDEDSENKNEFLTLSTWHVLTLQERRAIAKQNGFKSIGDFEESVIMEYEHEHNGDNDDESESSVEDQLMDEQLLENGKDDKSKTENKTTSYNQEEIEVGGLILILPHELIIHFILPFLPIEQYANCAMVSPYWKPFTRTESVYKELCKRAYLQQSKRKTLHVHRFGSYHAMLNTRFRVKTGCGFYVMKCTKIKKIQRDMWTEIPAGAILESTYYRYMNFFENGKLLYALTSKPPHEMIPIFQTMIQNNTSSKNNVNAVLGSYEIQKEKVTINVTHAWHHVRMVLRVLLDGYPGSRGRFWGLELEKHWSSKSANFDEYWSQDLVDYKVPVEPVFRFLREWRL